MKTSIYYINTLKQKLVEAQAKNPHYSLRAYARDLGIHPATLSLIIKSKRAFPLNSFDRVATALGLNETERNLFLESVAKVKFSIKKEVVSTLIKVTIPKEQGEEAEELIREFSKKIQNLGRPIDNGPTKNFSIKISRN
jgi:hypothetical protein